MNGNELADLIQQKWSILNHLLQISRLQMDAILHGQMSDLMRLLSDKQPPLNQLVEITGRLGKAHEDIAEERPWASEHARHRCREQQEECEKMNLELLAIEAECEAKLSQNREEVRERLARVDAGWQAVTGYTDNTLNATSGGTLDLSSD